MTAPHRPPAHGQTLVVFALVLGLFLIGMIALVADAGALFIAYNRFDGAALLAVQAGASAVDPASIYAGSLRLDQAQARLRCEQSLTLSGVRGSCRGTTPLAAVAEVSSRVDLPITVLGASASVHLVRSAKPAFGGSTSTVTT